MRWRNGLMECAVVMGLSSFGCGLVSQPHHNTGQTLPVNTSLQRNPHYRASGLVPCPDPDLEEVKSPEGTGHKRSDHGHGNSHLWPALAPRLCRLLTSYKLWFPFLSGFPTE